MKVYLFAATILISFFSNYFLHAQKNSQEINLLVRGDDMGFCHAVNEACIKSYENGIVKSVEVLVPGPWFLEAAHMLKELPGLDVGVHLCLTSEWESVKWRPITDSKSIRDSNGYFYPFIWKNDKFPLGSFLLDAKPSLDDVEKEFRAQIETAVKHIPRVSHLTAHMGCVNASDEIKQMAEKLAAEYNLPLEINDFKSLNLENKSKSETDKADELANIIKNLNPGNYLLVEHPGLDSPEMQAIGYKGYDKLAIDRGGVTYALTNEKVKKIIKSKQINLVSYRDVFHLRK